MSIRRDGMFFQNLPAGRPHLTKKYSERIEIEATIELDIPSSEDAATHAERIFDAINTLAMNEEHCVAWSMDWEPA